jgi:hypothetical protein
VNAGDVDAMVALYVRDGMVVNHDRSVPTGHAEVVGTEHAGVLRPRPSRASTAPASDTVGEVDHRANRASQRSTRSSPWP